MTFVFAVLMLTLSATLALGQSSALPEILIPTDAANALAARTRTKVFKILPRGTYRSSLESDYTDTGNPIGIREGGAYYSFTTQQHSYNKIPQIELQSGDFQSGFAGLDYGLMRDIGEIQLADISIENPEVTFLSTFKPRNLISEIRSEKTKRSEYKSDGIIYRNQLPAIVGHTYILRAISYDEADILVAFKPVSKLQNGAMEIIWKELKTFPVPKPWYTTDAEMAQKLNSILSQERFSGIKGEVKDNFITVRGVTNDRIKNDLGREFHNLRPVSINYLAETSW